MAVSDNEPALYREGVGVLLLNAEGKVFVGRRMDMPAGMAAWQMPQGGIDPGETAQQAALRELKEEIGTDKAKILAETRGWLQYDLPPEIAGTAFGGRYRGQRQKWFAMRFTGTDADIDPAASDDPEFDAWEWVEPKRLPELIVPFKRRLYLDVLEDFREYCRPTKA